MDNQKTNRIIGNNGESSLLVGETSIRVITKEVGTCPLGVITIVPGIQVQLGRTMTEFLECLRMVRKPIGTQKITSRGIQATYKVIRLKTGKVPSVVICTISTVNDIIMGVTFNQELNYNTEYTRYENLSIIHKLTAGAVGDYGLLSKAVEIVSIITAKPASTFKIKQFTKNIVVYTEIAGLKYQYRYTFSIDSRNYYNLLSVGYMLNK